MTFSDNFKSNNNIFESCFYYILFSMLMYNFLHFKFYIYYISVDKIYIDENHIVEKYKLQYSSNTYTAMQNYRNYIELKKSVHVCYANM